MQIMKYIAGVVVLSLLLPLQVFAHAFPVKNIPGAGDELTNPPDKVTIRFDADLEPIFSKLIVKDINDKQVSKGNGQVNKVEPKVLTTQLKPIGPGQYHVYWSVVSRDGHRTQGDYTFSVQGQGKS